MARIWTDEEIEFVREHAMEMPCADLLKLVNAKFGKSYSLEQLYRVKARCRIPSLNIGCYRKGIRNSPATEFKKGNVPHNKGTHPPTVGKMAETQFKKGNIPPNHKPVGTERISYGKIQIKVAEPNKWEWLATLIWQSVHKKTLPKGCVIRFANGDITDYSPENLVAVTRAQNAMLNHMHINAYDEDSLKAALLICELKMQKHKRERDVKRTKKRNHRNDNGNVGKICTV